MNIRFRENREIPAIWRKFTVHVGACFTIAASQLAGSQGSTEWPLDAQLLSAILKAAISDAGRADLRVDPRPLVANRELETVEPGAIAPVSALVVRRRTAVIRAAGLRTVDATRLNQNSDCPGVFVIDEPDSLGHTDDKHVGCPKESFAVLAVGPPRPGSAVLAGDGVYDRGSGTAARGYWAARVIRTSLGPGGSSVYASDYVLAKRAGMWVVIKIVGRSYTE